VITFLKTTDTIKLSAAEALLYDAGVDTTVFDRAAGTLWTSIIPMRLMIDDDVLPKARLAMSAAGWKQALDGDWDLVTR